MPQRQPATPKHKGLSKAGPGAPLDLAERFLVRLVRSGGHAVPLAGRPDQLCLPGGRGRIDRAEADDLVRRNLAAWMPGGEFAPTPQGLAWARRLSSTGFRGQHGEVVRAEVLTDEGPAAVALDLAESPLAWLRRRRGRDGAALIGDAAFAAGERLRAEFTRGQLSPRMTSHWGAPTGAAPRGSARLDPAEMALAARQRVRIALDRVGPELAGVLLDVCCFLKGLEEVERERRWPARSAKIVLGIALQRLAAHYGLSDQATGAERRGRIEGWVAPA